MPKRNTDTDIDNAKLFPDGRLFYYEGDDPIAFFKAMQALKLQLQVTVHVPAKLLDEVERAWPALGT